MKDRTVDALVIGAGPAGLMAAEMLSGLGVSVLIADAMPSPARKFLMAGKSGLNLTKMEDFDRFVAAFGDTGPVLEPILRDFGPEAVETWAKDLGQEVFTGSTRRLFPKKMKASPLLRAWLQRLEDGGVELMRRWNWVGMDANVALFETPSGPQRIGAKATVLALGGGSWARLGSTGKWASTLQKMGVPVAPFQPSNVGVEINWSDHMNPHFGQPLKGIEMQAGPLRTRGECSISASGLEGGGIYMLTPAIRDGAPLVLDLKPDLEVAELEKRIAKQASKLKTKDILRKAAGLSPAAIALLQEVARPLERGPALARVIKALPVPYRGLRPLDQAISTDGGLDLSALDGDLMVKSRPGLFAAGEMLNWEAPTGGYLINACLATGRRAGLAAGRFIAGH